MNVVAETGGRLLGTVYGFLREPRPRSVPCVEYPYRSRSVPVPSPWHWEEKRCANSHLAEKLKTEIERVALRGLRRAITAMLAEE